MNANEHGSIRVHSRSSAAKYLWGQVRTEMATGPIEPNG